MTDAGFRPPQGNQPPPPPGGMAPAPPPPGAPRNVPAAAQPLAAAPKKKGKGWIIALVISLVVVCAIVSFAAFAVFGGAGDKTNIAQAETHYAAASSAVGKAEQSIEVATADSSPEQIEAAVDESTKAIRQSRDEIAAAKVSIELIKDSPGKASYLASLAAATAALDGLEDLLGYVNTASGMASKVVEGGNLTNKANADLEDAISLGNKSSYSAMRAKAVRAASFYVKATFLFEEADKLDPSAGIKRAATYAGKRRQQADVVVRMAEAGKAGRLSAYNADIKKQAALGKAAEAAGLPEIVSNPNWTKERLAELAKSIDVEATKADELRKKALAELKYTP